MKRIACFCLFLFMIIVCLPSCTKPIPTKDAHAVVLGDSKKQVVEKAGEPDSKYGLGHDVFSYITDELEPEEKFFWLQNDKVIMIATYKNNDFTDWLVDESYAFHSTKRPKEISVWEPGLDILDIIGYFGPEFSDWLVGNFADIVTYELENGESLKIHFYMGLIQEAIYIEQDGKQTVLWKLGQNGSHLF